MILINVCPSRFDRKLNECPMRLINVCPLDVPTPPPPCSRFLINSTYYTFRPPPFHPILSRCTHLSPTLFKVFYKFDLLPAPLSAHNVSMYHLPPTLLKVFDKFDILYLLHGPISAHTVSMYSHLPHLVQGFL